MGYTDNVENFVIKLVLPRPVHFDLIFSKKGGSVFNSKSIKIRLIMLHKPIAK